MSTVACMAHAGYVGRAWPSPPQALASFLFIFRRHLENPLGRPISVHLARPKTFPARLKSFGNLKSLLKLNLYL
jgi:hypothetical protein